MLYNYFPVRLRKIVKKCMENRDDIEEIRVRCGQNIMFCNRGSKWYVNSSGLLTSSADEGVKLYKDDLKEMIKYFTQNSVYAMQQDIKNGFITLPNGTRVGLCGRCIIKNGEIENISSISSFNIRISRQIVGWGYDVFRKIGAYDKNVLIIAPPGYGKTTLLRNLIKYVSDYGKNISVIDEKSEISPMAEGTRIYDLGINTDILSDVPKDKGINMMLRTMNPEIVAVDEVLTEEDFAIIKNTALSGVRIFATFHGSSTEDYILKAKSFLGEYLEFDSYIEILENENSGRVISCKLKGEI